MPETYRALLVCNCLKELLVEGLFEKVEVLFLVYVLILF